MSQGHTARKFPPNVNVRRTHGRQQLKLRPGYSEEMQSRHERKHCGVMETIDHLLSECEAPGQSQIWALAESLWRKKGNVARLYRILVSESAHLIWRHEERKSYT